MVSVNPRVKASLEKLYDAADARKGSLQGAQDRLNALRVHIGALAQVIRSQGSACSACSELRSLSGERT